MSKIWTGGKLMTTPQIEGRNKSINNMEKSECCFSARREAGYILYHLEKKGCGKHCVTLDTEYLMLIKKLIKMFSYDCIQISLQKVYIFFIFKYFILR